MHRSHAVARFPAALASAAAARGFVAEQCQAWGIPSVTADAEVIASELVENAVRHANSPCVVTLDLAPAGLTIAVRDGSARPPRLLHPRPDEAGGRGLQLVRSVSSRWGYRQTDAGGKEVWAELTLAADPGNRLHEPDLCRR